MAWLLHHASLIAAIFGGMLAVSAVALVPLPLLREAIVVTRGHLMALALFIGLLGGAGILLGQMSLDHTAREAAARRGDLARQLERERARDRRDALSRREIRAIARRTARLERPTAAELLSAIRHAADVCRTHPRQCARAAQDFRAATTTSPAGPASPRPAAQPPVARSPRRRPKPPRPDRPAPSPPPSDRPTPSTTPSGQPPPPVDIHPPPLTPLPPLPPVCTGIVDLGCPRP